MVERGVVPIRGFLLHITHYDPKWCRAKAEEKPFDLDMGLEIIDTMAEVGLNLLVIDCADGVAYRSHPELARHYTVPMSHLEKLVARAGEKGIEVVPKLNFAQSHHHRHNDWFRPYHDLFDNEEYWQRAFQIIDELIEVCHPPRFFHVGMDEDHNRAYSQYNEAIRTLHAGLAERGLRTVIWNDSPRTGKGLVTADKSRAAEGFIPKDIVQVPWNYRERQTEHIRRLCEEGFEVWGAPGWTPELVSAWREDIVRYGGTGLLLTRWIPCQRSNRTEFMDVLRNAGPSCR